jgi:hypothetical protein
MVPLKKYFNKNEIKDLKIGGYSLIEEIFHDSLFFPILGRLKF